MPIPSIVDLTAAVAALFEDAPLAFYVSIVDPAPPVDDNQIVTSYAVLHPGPGDATTGSLDQRPGHLLWSFHITAAGGDHNYCGFAVEQVRARIDGHRLTVNGMRVGLMQPPFGAVPPLMAVNNTVHPPRLSVPLEYRVLTVPA